MEDGFDSQSQFPTPPVSPLLAMGTSGPRFGRRWLVVIGVVGSLLLSLIIFTLLCSGTFFLPPQTITFATASPRTLNLLLTSEQKDSLPIEWQQTLRQDSRWPVIFGLTGSRDTIRAFTLGPRWSVPAPLLQTTGSKTRALIRQVGEVTSANNQPLVYRELFFDHAFAAGSPRGWLNASLLFPNASSTNRILFHAEEGKLFLSDTGEAFGSANQLTAEAGSSQVPLQADVSLHLSALGKQTNIDLLLGELPLDPVQTTITSLHQPPASLEARFTSSTIDALRLTFREPVSSAERSALLSQLQGTQQKKLLTLPDGTIAVEQRATSVPSSSSEQGDATAIDWQLSADAQTIPNATACSPGVWLARFSPRLLERFLTQDSVFASWIPKQPVQIWRHQNQLVVCLER